MASGALRLISLTHLSSLQLCDFSHVSKFTVAHLPFLRRVPPDDPSLPATSALSQRAVHATFSYLPCPGGGMADAEDLKSSGVLPHVGSTPTPGTSCLTAQNSPPWPETKSALLPPSL